MEKGRVLLAGEHIFTSKRVCIFSIPSLGKIAQCLTCPMSMTLFTSPSFHSLLPDLLPGILDKQQEPNRFCCCSYHPEQSVPFACLFPGCAGSAGFKWCWKKCRWRPKQSTRSEDGGSAGCLAGCIWHNLVSFNMV